MQWNIPGTVIPVDLQQDPHIEERIRGMFLGGGMMLGQITAVTGLEPYTVQNWVKRGFLPAPENKRYTLRQLFNGCVRKRNHIRNDRRGSEAPIQLCHGY